MLETSATNLSATHSGSFTLGNYQSLAAWPETLTISRLENDTPRHKRVETLQDYFYRRKDTVHATEEFIG